MDWLDVSTYVVQNVAGFFCFLGAGVFVGLILGGMIGEAIGKKAGLYVFCGVVGLSAMMGAFSLVPTHDKILAVKIAKIKNEAVTEENLRQGVEVIERIGKKLECKYLGCDEGKK